ncbi:MAG TPA: hypothetical protein VF572_06850 [Candidatus Saccharimonadales bacterium]
MSSLQKPVLLSRSELGYGIDDVSRELPVDAIDPVLERMQHDPSVANGVHKAAELLLTEAAVSVVLIDVTDPTDSIRPENPPVYHRKLQLGFNDHGAGTESDYKVLLNVQPDSEAPIGQFVLYSPADEAGEPLNMTFHRSRFSNVRLPSKNLDFPKHVPNPIKTAAAARYHNREDYEFLLFGGQDTPHKLADTFESIGFRFDDEPYDWDEYDEIRFATVPRGRHEWPDGQFKKQVNKLWDPDDIVEL